MAKQLEKILQDVQASSPAEQRPLCRLLAKSLSALLEMGPGTEETFQQQLVAAGLLGESKPLDTPQPPSARRPRVTIQGEPLSATVMQERR